MVHLRGTLKTWKSDKGFGFIRPDDGSKDVFVHVRDFGNINRSPKVGDVVNYQPIKDGTGKVRAGDVHIEGLPRLPAQPRKPKRKMPPSIRTPTVATILTGLLFGGVIIVALNWYDASKIEATTHALSGIAAQKPTGQFECEGKEHCSQMRSCDEAMFYIRNCPNVKMDGDGDGIPCERQWC